MIKKQNFIKEQIAIFIYLCFQILIRTAEPSNMVKWPWRTTPYALNYSLGIGSRFFMGSFISLFTKHLTFEFLWAFILAFEIILCGLVTVLLGKVLRSVTEGNKNIVIFLVCLFLASPANFYLIFSQNNYGAFDLYLIVLTLAMLILADNKYLRWLIPVLCIVCVAIHQIFVCAYMVLICIPLLYKAIDSKFKKSDVLLALVTYGGIIVSFLYFQFFKNPLPFANETALAEHLKQNVDIPVTSDMLKWEYFATFEENLRECVYVGDWKRNIAAGVTTLIMLLPLFILFGQFFRKAMKYTEKKVDKIYLFVSMIAPLITLPAFITTKDFDRWFAAAVFCQFGLIFYFIVKKQNGVLKELSVLKKFTRSHKILSATFILYLASLMYVSHEAMGNVGLLFEEIIKGVIR